MSGTSPTLAVRRWSELGRDDLYEILRLRAEVFVVEQACVYLDPDGRDREATHLLARAGGMLVGYARWYPASDGATHLGRIVTTPSWRGRGLGRRLVAAALDAIGVEPVELKAQAHLERLYAAFGFRATGPVFDDAGIPHVPMRRES